MDYVISVFVIIVGLVVSLWIGHLITNSVSRYLKWGVKDKTDEGNIPRHDYGVPGWKVGLIERTVFTFFVGMNPGASAVGVFAWITLKLAVTWRWAEDQYKEENKKEKGEKYLEALTGYRLVSLLSNLVSMFSAFTGGLILHFYSNKCLPVQTTGVFIIVIAAILVGCKLRRITPNNGAKVKQINCCNEIS